MLIDLLREMMDVVLPPGGLIIIALIAGVIAWRLRMIWPLLVALLLVWTASATVVGQFLVHGLEYADSRPEHLAGDVLVVLGEGAVADTPQAGGAGSLSGEMASEFLTVVRLARTTHLPVIISGGSGSFDDGNEADIGLKVLRGLGIHKLFVDNRSQTTYQNATDTEQIMHRHGWTRAVLVTSAVHMVQAVEDFRASGVSVTPYPTNYQTPRRLDWGVGTWVPSLSGLTLTTEALQEYLSLVAYRLGVK